MVGLSLVRGAARVVVVVVALAMPLRTAASQTVLVSNVGQPTRDNTIVSEALWAAQAFVTDGSSYLLAYIETLLGLRVGSPTIVSELRADIGGLPGALLTTFTFGSVSTGAPSLMTLTPGSAVALSPTTAYWLVFGASGAGSFGWSYAEGNVTTGPGSLASYAYSTDAGVSWGSTGTENPYQIAVNVTSPTTVPEPATLSLLALGLVGAVAPFRRRFRRQS